MQNDNVSIDTMFSTAAEHALAAPLIERITEIEPMQIRKGLVAAGLAAALFLTGCGTTTPLRNPEPTMITVQATPANVRDAIIESAYARKWRIVNQRSGEIQLAYPDNAKSLQFEALVKVTYSADQYAISYISSRGLDERIGCGSHEGVTCLHRNVNRWMNNLNKDIITRLYQKYR